ncbi:hypothetical protein D3C85_891340 [compost metagenome]
MINRFGIAALFLQPVRGHPVQAQKLWLISAAQALIQGAPQHWVIAVGQAFATALLDKHVLALQLLNQPRCVALPTQFDGQFAVEGVDDRSALEKGQELIGQVPQHFFLQKPGGVVDTCESRHACFRRLVGDRVRMLIMVAKAEQNAADPAFAGSQQVVAAVTAQRHTACGGQFPDLHAVEYQALRVQYLQPIVPPQMSETQGRRTFAGRHQPQVGRGVPQQFVQVAASPFGP